MRVPTIRKFFASSLLACTVTVVPAMAAAPATAAPASLLAGVAREGGSHSGDHSGGGGTERGGDRRGPGPQASSSADNRRTDDQSRTSGNTQGRRIDDQTMDSNTTDNRRASDREQPIGPGEAPWDNGHNDDSQPVARMPVNRGR